MNESHSELPFNTTTNYNSNNSGVDIPTELVSEEEMASIEAALASASSYLSSSTVAELVSEEEMASIEAALASTCTLTSSSTASVLVSEEEMASIEASLASTRSSLSSSAVPAICSTSQSQSHSQYESFQRNARSIQLITLRAKRRFSFCTEPSDIEDLGSLRSNQKKKSRVAGSFFHRFRNKTGLFVRDITATVWISFFGGVREMGLIYFC